MEVEAGAKIKVKYKLKKDINGTTVEDTFNQIYNTDTYVLNTLLDNEGAIISNMRKTVENKEYYDSNKEYLISFIYFRICEEDENGGLPKLIDIYHQANLFIQRGIQELSTPYLNNILGKIYDLPSGEDGAEVKIEFIHNKNKYETKKLDKAFIEKVEKELLDEIVSYLQEHAELIKPSNMVTRDEVKKIILKHHLTHIDYDGKPFTGQTEVW